MKTLKLFTLLIAVLWAGSALAADMGTSYGFDLDSLWAQAQKTYDTAAIDAVVLLEDREVTQSQSGAVATTVHRVIWINSSTAIHAYADLRVPWNTTNSELKVEVLRTWRDGRWWPDKDRISETAVVPTLPHAVDHADDYTALRETMLLHDGIELPCILETRYTITRRGAPAASGTFVFPQRDPAVRARLSVTVPDGVPWHQATLHGAPRPTEDTSAGAHTTVWDMQQAGQLGLPVPSMPAAFEPAVVYSTWQDWKTVGAVFSAAFAARAHIGPALTDSVASRADHATDTMETVSSVLDFVTESTRHIPGDWRLWDQARSADRVWGTAYGHDLDRVALAAGAIRGLAMTPVGGGGSSLSADPVFLGPVAAPALAPDVPRLDDHWSLALRIGLGDGEVLFWSPDGQVHGAAWATERPLFVPAEGQTMLVNHTGVDNRLACDLIATPQGDGGITWSGNLTAQGLFSPHGAVYQGQTMEKAAGELLGAVLPDAEVETCTPRAFSAQVVTLRCGGSLAVPEEAKDGTMTLVLGDPGNGVLQRLPGDIHLYQGTRSSAFMLPPLSQDITVRLPLDRLTVVRMPSDVSVSNAAGHCAISAQVADGWVVYRRAVQLTGQGTWPELRAVLLEAREGRNRDIVLKAGGRS